METFIFGNSGSYLELLDEYDNEDNVLLSLSTDKRKDRTIEDSKARIDLYMNKSTADLIFGFAITNCMTNNIDSKFTFTNIYDRRDKKVSLILEKMNTYIGAEEKEKVVVCPTISISKKSKKAKVKIIVKYKVGFINEDTDKFDYILPDYCNLPNKIELDFKDCFDLISLVTLPRY